jgi:folate-dependent phosphoribosylglycinamide formyltransferase PurN
MARQSIQRKRLSRLMKPIVNIHDGIIPTFRNVHTDFWAYFTHQDFPFGVTLFEINDFIDAGKIVRQQVLEPGEFSSFRDGRRKLADLRVALALSVVGDVLRGEGSGRVVSSEADVGRSWPSFPLWSNPTIRDILSVVFGRELSPRYVESRRR